MAEGFDPYRAWLDVREPHRPLNAYQLLKLPALEEDTEAIQVAAGQQRAAMELHRDEAHPATWRQVHSELEAAIDLLLDANLKAAYDLALKSAPDAWQLRPAGALGKHSAHAAGKHSASAAATAAPAASADGNDELLACQQCGHKNPATRKFCSACGKNLWQACPTCGTLSVAEERFCGACGVNLASTLERLVEQFQGEVQKAEQLRAEHRYQEAIAVLTGAVAVERPSMIQHIASAKRLMEEMTKQRDRSAEEARASCQRAAEQLAAHEFDQAVATLEAIPEPVRTAEACELLVRRGPAGTRRLCWNARCSRRPPPSGPTACCPRSAGCWSSSPTTRRRGAWRTTSAPASSTTPRRGWSCIAMRKRRDSWSRFRPGLRTAAAVELLDRARELAWLVRDLRSAPVVDATLPAVVERLREMSPSDSLAEKLGAEMQRRLKIAAGKADAAGAPWVRPPETSVLGPPLSWLTGFRHIDVQAVRQSPAFAEHPGCFFVACGLALQGLGQAPLETNLLPTGNRTVLGRIAKIAKMRVIPRAARSAWGIDLGASGLKAVRLAWDDGPGRLTITACDYVAYGKARARPSTRSTRTAC